LKKVEGTPRKVGFRVEEEAVPKNRNLQQELMDILEDQEVCTIFRNYLKHKLCEENLMFWIDVELYRDADATLDRNLEEKAQYMWDRYVSDSKVTNNL
jgi:hypothetical protein